MAQIRFERASSGPEPMTLGETLWRLWMLFWHLFCHWRADAAAKRYALWRERADGFAKWRSGR